MTQASGTGGGPKRPWPALVAALALVAAPAVFWGGGVIEEEAVGFLGRYWSDLSLGQKIFDPRGWDDYQGRELSYLVDWADAQWVHLLLEHGRPLFAPPSATLSLLAMVGAFWWGVPRVFPALDPRASWPILLLYLSGFAALSTTGILYRATKPLVAPLLLALLLFVLAAHRREGPPPARAFWVVTALGTTMGLLDRQGLFYLAGVTGVLLAAFLVTRRGLRLVAGAAAAIVAVLFYNYVLGPVLIRHFNGYWPSLRFQHPSPRWLFDPAAWREGLLVLGDWTSTLFGGIPAGLVALAAAAVGAWAWRAARPRPHPLVPALAVLAIVAQAAMVTLMVRRHEPVTWIDHRIWYYPLPYQALLLFLMLWALDRAAASRGGRLPWPIPVAALGLVAANVAGWPGMRRVMESGPWFGDVSRRSVLLQESLATGVPSPLLDGDYRRFLFECRDRFPRIAARMAPHVSEGNGVGVVRLDGGRLVASAERESRFVAFAPKSGRYRLEGTLGLRPDQAVLVALDTTPPRALGEVRRAEGPLESFALEVELPQGPTGILLRAVEAASGPRRGGRPLAFRLVLPLRLVPSGG